MVNTLLIWWIRFQFLFEDMKSRALYGQLRGSYNVNKERIKSRRPFVPVAQKLLKLLDCLSEISICATQWINTKRNKKYSKSMSTTYDFIPRVSIKLMGMGFLEHLGSNSTDYVYVLNAFVCRNKNGVPASFSNCNHIISKCPTHWAPEGISCLMVFDGDTRCRFNTLSVSI